jgi:hypothetical protein
MPPVEVEVATSAQHKPQQREGNGMPGSIFAAPSAAALGASRQRTVF